MNRLGFAFFGFGAIALAVGSAFLPVARADCTTLFGDDVVYDVGRSKSVAIGDLDGDGDADLATANWVFGGAVVVLLNNGDGIFTFDNSYDVGDQYPTSVAIGDLDGDGDADLAVTNEGDPRRFSTGDRLRIAEQRRRHLRWPCRLRRRV